MYIWGVDQRDLVQFINKPYYVESIDAADDMSFERWINNFSL